MKNLFIIALTAGNLTTIAASAGLRPDIPKAKLTLTDAQINAIKNERARPAKNNTPDIFGMESDDDEPTEEAADSKPMIKEEGRDTNLTDIQTMKKQQSRSRIPH